MAVKVVQGLVGASGSPIAGANAQSSTADSQIKTAINQASSTQAQRVVSSDAVVSNIRQQRSTQGSERIREYKQAQSLSQEVAEQIRSNPDASAEVHDGISSTSGQGHLSE